MKNEVYLIGGYNKKNIASKEVWLYERAYNMMRIVAVMKQGRVGHCLCSSSLVMNEKGYGFFPSDPDFIYIFGGRGVSSL